MGWDTLVKRAMKCDFSWEKSAKEYAALYEEVLGKGGSDVRERTLINCGWEYIPKWRDEFVQPGLSADGFVKVTIPHANKEISYNYFDERDYQFVSCYRRTIVYQASWAGKRVLADFDGVMAYAEVYLNGRLVGSHKGGYTPFSVDLTAGLQPGENLLVVKVDSTERPDIPPFGYTIDYLCYGGIYRDVYLRVVEPVFVENVFAKPKQVLNEKKGLETTVFVSNTTTEEHSFSVVVKLSKDGRLIAEGSRAAVAEPGKSRVDVVISNLSGIELWDVDNPISIRWKSLQDSKGVQDTYTTRIGFREAVVRPDGFYLNGRKMMIRGLNRHQAFPYVGYAMPARVQRRDADILKYELGLNALCARATTRSRRTFWTAATRLGSWCLRKSPAGSISGIRTGRRWPVKMCGK